MPPCASAYTASTTAPPPAPSSRSSAPPTHRPRRRPRRGGRGAPRPCPRPRLRERPRPSRWGRFPHHPARFRRVWRRWGRRAVLMPWRVPEHPQLMSSRRVRGSCSCWMATCSPAAVWQRVPIWEMEQNFLKALQISTTHTSSVCFQAFYYDQKAIMWDGSIVVMLSALNHQPIEQTIVKLTAV